MKSIPPEELDNWDNKLYATRQKFYKKLVREGKITENSESDMEDFVFGLKYKNKLRNIWRENYGDYMANHGFGRNGELAMRNWTPKEFFQREAYNGKLFGVSTVQNTKKTAQQWEQNHFKGGDTQLNFNNTKSRRMYHRSLAKKLATNKEMEEMLGKKKIYSTNLANKIIRLTQPKRKKPTTFFGLPVPVRIPPEKNRSYPIKSTNQLLNIQRRNNRKLQNQIPLSPYYLSQIKNLQKK